MSMVKGAFGLARGQIKHSVHTRKPKYHHHTATKKRTVTAPQSVRVTTNGNTMSLYSYLIMRLLGKK